jgi:hypothetical protein
MANDCIPYKEEADRITGKVTPAAGATGKRIAVVTGPRTSTLVASGQGQGLVADASADKANVYSVGQATVAGARALGVFAFDAPQNAMVTIIREGIVPITAGAAITAGVDLDSDNQGRVVPHTTGIIVGTALDTQATVGADCEVVLLLGT